MGLLDLFHKDPPDDATTRRWEHAHEDLDNIFDAALSVRWYDFLLGLPGLLLDAPGRRDAVMPFYDRGNQIEEDWQRAVDAEDFNGRYDAADKMEQLAKDARAALLDANGSPSKSLGAKAEDVAGRAADSLLFGVGVGTVLVVAVLAAVAIYGARK